VPDFKLSQEQPSLAAQLFRKLSDQRLDMQLSNDVDRVLRINTAHSANLKTPGA
jgi:hypothetical protein